MIKFKTLLVFFLLIFQSSLLAYSSNPKEFVSELVNEAINTLADKDLDKKQKVEIITKIALENVDIDALSLYTLGELRKSANKEELQKYKQSFEKYFLKSLTSRLSDYSSSKFEVEDADKKSSNYTIVNKNYTWRQ